MFSMIISCMNSQLNLLTQDWRTVNRHIYVIENLYLGSFQGEGS